MLHVCSAAVVGYGKGRAGVVGVPGFARRAVPQGKERQGHACSKDLRVLTRHFLAC